MIFKPVWRLRDIPELAHLPPGDRARIIRRAGSPLAGMYVWMLAGALALPPAAGVLAFATDALSSPLPHITAGVAVLVFAMVAYQLIVLFLRIFLRNAVLDAQPGEQLPACLRCGYDLRGSESATTCPECGAGVVAPKSRHA